MINPKRVILKCRLGHEHVYDISGPEELDCCHSSCDLKINSSKVMRGSHPYIVWSEYTYVNNFCLYHAIPLTSQETFKGLPTTYPIKPNLENGLACKSYAMVHQLTPIDPECFKDRKGNWMKRLGIISANEKNDIRERLSFALNLPNYPSEDWFSQNASPELLEKVFIGLPSSQREEGLSRLLDLT